MKTLILIAATLYIGKEVFLKRERVQVQEREGMIRKRLEKFIRENHPTWSALEVKRELDILLEK